MRDSCKRSVLMRVGKSQRFSASRQKFSHAPRRRPRNNPGPASFGSLVSNLFHQESSLHIDRIGGSLFGNLAKVGMTANLVEIIIALA